MPADIPPPSEADLKTNLAKAYSCSNLLPPPGGDVVASFIRRCHAAEAECERLRGLRDRAEAAFKELEEAERRLDRLAEAVKENDSLRSELDEAVKALVPFADANGYIRSGTGETVTVRIAVQRSDHDDISYRLITRDFRTAAAFVAKHKGNA